MARILVTGCSSGMGRATALALSARGHDVIATARRIASIADMDVAVRLPLDITDQQSVDRCVGEAGQIDVLVNNSGVSVWGSIELTTMDDLTRLFETNVLGGVRMAKAVLPAMRARGRGRILNISSDSARMIIPLVAGYSATKAALESLSLALREEVAEWGIEVGIVTMGAVRTSIGDNRAMAPFRGTPYEASMNALLQRTTAGQAKALPAEQAGAAIADIAETDKLPARQSVEEWLASASRERAC